MTPNHREPWRRGVLPEDQREDRSGPAVAPARPALLRQRRLSGAGLCISGTISGSRIPRPMDQTGGRIQRQPHLRHRRDQSLRLSRPNHRTAPARVSLQARPAILSRLGRRAGGLAGRCSDFRTALAADRGALAARSRRNPPAPLPARAAYRRRDRWSVRRAAARWRRT